MSDDDVLYIVDPYMDRITARPAKQVLKEAVGGWFAASVKNRFATEEQAEQFVLDRAAQRCSKARAELKKEERKYREVARRFKGLRRK